MGASSSSPATPPRDITTDETGSADEIEARKVRLVRTMTPTSLDIITEQLMKARAEVDYFKDIAEESVEALHGLSAELDWQKKQVIIVALGAAAVGVAAGAVGAGMMARQKAAAQSLQLAQQLAETRRRGAGELEKAAKYASSELGKSLIPAMDAMDMLCDSAASARNTETAPSTDDAAVLEGSRLTRSLLLEALQKNGIERVEPAVGDKFDVATMEAMLSTPVTERSAAGLVEHILRPGYVLQGDRVLRAAQVGVGVHDGSGDVQG